MAFADIQKPARYTGKTKVTTNLSASRGQLLALWRHCICKQIQYSKERANNLWKFCIPWQKKKKSYLLRQVANYSITAGVSKTTKRLLKKMEQHKYFGTKIWNGITQRKDQYLNSIHHRQKWDSAVGVAASICPRHHTRELKLLIGVKVCMNW